MRRLGVRTRWAVPVGAVAVTGIIIAAATVATAEAAPSLPARTPRQLLTEVAQGMAKPLGPLTATVQQTVNLGLPALPLPAQQGGATGSSSGQQSVTIWYRDPRHVRVAEQVPAGETDLRLDGRTLWTWNSKTQTATRYALPAGSSHAGSAVPGTPVPETPPAAAARLLKAIGPTTVVSVKRDIYVAGRAAYQLSLAPRSSKSLVGSVLIAIDASRHVPLRVEVYPRGSSAVAYSIGFTALSFGTPAASNFRFTPPPGATVKKVTVPGNLKSLASQAGLGSVLSRLPLAGLPLGSTLFGAAIGSKVAAGAASPARLSTLLPRVVKTAGGKLVIKTATGKIVAVKPATAKLIIGRLARTKLAKLIPAVTRRTLRQIEAGFARSLPASMSKAQRAAAIKAFDQHLAQHLLGRPVTARLGNNGGGLLNLGTGGLLSGWTAYAPLTAVPQAGAPRVIGTSWLSVVATPPNPQVAAAVTAALHGSAGSAPASTSQASSPASSVSPPAGRALAVLPALLKAAQAVHGTWGRGWLLKTSLLTVLVTTKGQILAGAVTKSVLYADVAADAG